MPYCTGCGAKIEDSDAYCSGCGQKTHSESPRPTAQNTEANGETVTLGISDSDTGSDRRIYRVSNIVYTRLIDSELTTPAILLIVGIPTLAVLTAYLISDTPSTLAGIATIPVIWWYARPSNGLDIATLTEVDYLAASDTGRLESQIGDKIPNAIRIEGSIKTPLISRSYLFRFHPENIVSVERKPGILLDAILPPIVVAVGATYLPYEFLQGRVTVSTGLIAAGSILAVFYWLRGNLCRGSEADFVWIPVLIGTVSVVSIAATVLQSSSLILIAWLLALGVFGGLLISPGDRLKLRLTNGETREERMTADDINRVLSAFES